MKIYSGQILYGEKLTNSRVRSW